jgi:hypothetical protein
MVAHSCNHSYSGGGYQEDCCLRPGGAKSKTSISINKMGLVVHPVILAMWEEQVEGSWSEVSPGKNTLKILSNSI